VHFASPIDLTDGVSFDCTYVATEQTWERRDLRDAIHYAQLVKKILP
jgi:hypothetical protein